jgi:hypothetical protein
MTGVKCDESAFCMCEIKQEEGTQLTDCQAGTGNPPPGYCYIDDPKSMYLKNCPENQKQLLRFVDDSVNKTPAQGAIAFIACLGAAINGDGGM